MTEANFMKWAVEQKKKIDYVRFFTYHLLDNVIVCYDKRTGRLGLARCHPEDTFNPVIGRAIAYTRCIGQEVPKISTYKKLSQMKMGDHFNKARLSELVFIGKCINTDIRPAYAVQDFYTKKILIFADGDQNMKW